MTTVLLCRDGAAARYVAHEVASTEGLDAVVVESGRPARRRKLRREWARTSWWRVPLFALDLAALAIYGRLWKRALSRRLRGHPAAGEYPAGLRLHEVEDVNDPDCLSILAELRPEVLLVFGTSLLGTPVLKVPSGVALNIHGGVVPAYRNVHSEVWAVLNGEASQVGTSILHLDEGIDSGAIALQAAVEGARGFFDLRWRNLQLGARLASQAVARYREGSLPRVPQTGAGGFYPTPGVAQLTGLAVTGLRGGAQGAG